MAQGRAPSRHLAGGAATYRAPAPSPLLLLLCVSLVALAPTVAAVLAPGARPGGAGGSDATYARGGLRTGHGVGHTARGAWALASQGASVRAARRNAVTQSVPGVGGATEATATASHQPLHARQPRGHAPAEAAHDRAPVAGVGTRQAAGTATGTQSGSVPASWDACTVLDAMPYDWLPIAGSFTVPQTGSSGNVGSPVQPSPLSWMGGDCDTSVRLNASAFLWIFGDTLLGTWSVGPPGVPGNRQWAGIHMPHQSAAVIRAPPTEVASPATRALDAAGAAEAGSLNDGRVHFYWRQDPANASIPLSMFTPAGQAQPGYDDVPCCMRSGSHPWLTAQLGAVACARQVLL